MAKDYKDYGDNVVIHRGGTLVSFPRPANWDDNYNENKKRKEKEEEKPKKQEYVKLTGPEEDALIGLDGRKFDSPEDLASAMVMERNNRIGDFEAELDGMEEQGLDVSMYKEEGWDDEVNYNEALEKIKSNPNQFEKYLRTKEKESSLKKGDIYENEYGTKVEIMEVDDKGQTLHKFTMENGTTDYKNLNEKDVRSMLQHNNYKKVSQDDFEEVSKELSEIANRTGKKDLFSEAGQRWNQLYKEDKNNVSKDLGDGYKVSVGYDGRISMNSSHPYDDTDYSWASKNGDKWEVNNPLTKKKTTYDTRDQALQEMKRIDDHIRSGEKVMNKEGVSKHLPPKTPSQDNIDNSYFNTYKKDQERLDKAREKMSKPVEKKEKTKEELEKENLLSGIPKKKDNYKYEYKDGMLTIKDKKGNEYNSYGLSKENYEDNPQYWKDRAKQELDEELYYLNKEVTEDPYMQEHAKFNTEYLHNKKGYSYKQISDMSNDEYDKHFSEWKTSNDNYKEYYKKENLGEPSNYKPGDEIEFDTGYYSKLKGKVIKEANYNEKKYQMNTNVKGYVVRDENGFEHIVPDTRILNKEKMVEKTNKAYKDNKPIIDSNKKTTNNYMNDKIRNSRKKSEDQIAREQLEKYKDKLKDPTKSKVTKADIKKTFKK